MTRLQVQLLLAFALGALSPRALSQVLMTEKPEPIQDVELTERLGERVPLNLRVTDSTGDSLMLADVFNGDRPVVMALVYYECPVVCTLVMDRMAEAFGKLDYAVGEDFEAFVMSFDPTETPTHAKATKETYLAGYNKLSDSTPEAWRFTVAEPETIEALANAVGFGTKLLPDGEYAHPVAIMVLSPDGKITRYLYGFDYPARELKLSLLDATEGKIAKSLGDRFLHYCYRFDPTAGAYTMQAMNLMRLGGVLTIIAISALLAGLFSWERAKRRLAKKNTDTFPEDAGAPVGVLPGHAS